MVTDFNTMSRLNISLLLFSGSSSSNPYFVLMLSLTCHRLILEISQNVQYTSLEPESV